MLKQDIALLLEAADKRPCKSIFKNGQVDHEMEANGGIPDVHTN